MGKYECITLLLFLRYVDNQCKTQSAIQATHITYM